VSGADAGAHGPRFPLPGGHELRPFEPSDAPEMFALAERNRPDLARWLSWAQEPRKLEDTVERIEQMRAAEVERRAVDRAIVVEGRIVGTVGLARVDLGNRCTEIGYWLGSEHQGRGLMTSAVAVLVGHAFDSLNLNRSEIRTDVLNLRSRAVAERLGFRYEGTLRQAYRVSDDRYSDDAVYSMLASDPERRALARRYAEMDT
jgi:ribosomal-protein-serine acetyltransferase